MPSTERADSTGFIHARPRVLVDGEDRPDLNDAVQAAEVCLPLHGRAHAELRLVNWLNGDMAFREIRLGDSISLEMGESSEAPVMDGEITGIEERYGEGAPQLVLLVEDKLHRLARQRNNRRFEAMTVDEVIEQVLGDTNLSGDTNVNSATATWLQMNESNLAFLMRLVAAYGLGLRMEGDRVRAKPEEEDREPLGLSPEQGTAKIVRIVTDLNHQPSSVTIQGHDLSSDETVMHEANRLQLAANGTLASDELSRLGWETASVIPHPFARRQSDAEAMANGQFNRAASRFLYGEILCSGAPGLRAGREIDLSDVSDRLAGRYRISDCRHVFGAAGYDTLIKVQKAGHA